MYQGLCRQALTLAEGLKTLEELARHDRMRPRTSDTTGGVVPHHESSDGTETKSAGDTKAKQSGPPRLACIMLELEKAEPSAADTNKLIDELIALARDGTALTEQLVWRCRVRQVSVHSQEYVRKRDRYQRLRERDDLTEAERRAIDKVLARLQQEWDRVRSDYRDVVDHFDARRQG